MTYDLYENQGRTVTAVCQSCSSWTAMSITRPHNSPPNSAPQHKVSMCTQFLYKKCDLCPACSLNKLRPLFLKLRDSPFPSALHVTQQIGLVVRHVVTLGWDASYRYWNSSCISSVPPDTTSIGPQPPHHLLLYWNCHKVTHKPKHFITTARPRHDPYLAAEAELHVTQQMVHTQQCAASDAETHEWGSAVSASTAVERGHQFCETRDQSAPQLTGAAICTITPVRCARKLSQAWQHAVEAGCHVKAT
jgi:hypothetical protein